MQTPFLHLSKTFTPSPLPRQTNNQCFGLHNAPLVTTVSRRPRRIVAQQSFKPNDRPGNKGKVTLKGNKENIWSVDNEMAENEKRKRKPKGGRKRGKRLGKGRVLVSGTMLIETETVLQTQVSTSVFFKTIPSVKVMIFNYKNRFFFYKRSL